MNITRRSFLAGFLGSAAVLSGARAGLITQAGPRLFVSAPATFDFYISPSGSDSNDGLTTSTPWAITAINSKRGIGAGKYGGKRVGLMDGTYNVYSFSSTGAAVLLQVGAGVDAANPTVIQAVNARQAIITAKSGGSYNNAAAIIGSGANGTGTNPAIQYIEIRDLEITGSSVGLVSFEADGQAGGSQLGIVVSGCLLHDMVNPDGGSNKGGISFGTSIGYGLITNNHIYDCYQGGGYPRTSVTNSAAIYDWALYTTTSYNTIHDCNLHCYQKNQGGSSYPQGAQFHHNYCYTGSSGSGGVFEGFDNTVGASPPYATANIYNNVFEGLTVYTGPSAGQGFQAPWNFYNNTIWLLTDQSAGPMVSKPSGGPWQFVDFYNNIIARSGAASGAYGDVSMGPTAGDWQRCNYNCYPATPSLGISATGTTYATLYSFSAWKALTGTPDVNSIATGTPGFYFNGGSYSAGAGSAQFQLAPGAACIGAGVSGANLGACGTTGSPISVGSSF